MTIGRRPDLRQRSLRFLTRSVYPRPVRPYAGLQRRSQSGKCTDDVGNADFYVPTGADIDVGGLTVFGHRREHGDDSAPAADAPLVRIRVYSLFGTSDVWHVPREANGSFGELIRSVRERGLAPEGRS